MSGMIAILLSILLTAMSWGFYGPVLHWGQHGMSGSRLLPFICVGISYFFIAILIPIYILVVHSEKGTWTRKGIIWSLAAGALGAFGALGVVLALSSGGRPIYVMPLIFGGAPVVNTVVTMISTKTYRVQPLFLAGLAGVILGAGLVLTNKPLPTKAATEALDWSGLLVVLCFVCMTALCWGSYGTFLHKGQALMQGSRMRPYMCVGISYFLIGVLVPMGLLQLSPDGIPAWTWDGAAWSLTAGCCGAFGALGIILAFTFGGRPIYVMPLVFSGAPVINTFVTMVLAAEALTTPSILFFLGLVSVVTGAVLVLVFAPKPGKVHATPAAEPAEPAQAPVSS